MKTTAKNAIRDESGKILILVLVLLVVGGLLLGPLLGLMSTGLVSGQVYEKKASELYAADAGVEEAVWKITYPVLAELPHSACRDVAWSRNYTIADVNGREVRFTIDYLGEEVYAVTSIATANGSGTKIDALVLDAFRVYGGITDNIITSQDSIGYPPFPQLIYPEGHGPVAYYDGPWPDLETLKAWYREAVWDQEYHSNTSINLLGVNRTLGSLYVDGTLDITNSVNTPATLTLGGTVFVTGITTITPTHRMTLDLNGQALFVTSDAKKPPKEALYIGGGGQDQQIKLDIKGPGVIVAWGDIYFRPNIISGADEPIFIISVDGKTTLKPGGDFYGAIAGSVQVDLQPGARVVYPEDGFPADLNWPGFLRGRWAHYIASWTVGPG